MADSAYATHGLRHTHRNGPRSCRCRELPDFTFLLLSRASRGIRAPTTHVFTIAFSSTRQIGVGILTPTFFVACRFQRSLIDHRRLPCVTCASPCLRASVIKCVPPATHAQRAAVRRALRSWLATLFLKYWHVGTITVRTLCVTVASLSPVLGRSQSGEADPWAVRTRRLSLC